MSLRSLFDGGGGMYGTAVLVVKLKALLFLLLLAKLSRYYTVRWISCPNSVAAWICVCCVNESLMAAGCCCNTVELGPCCRAISVVLGAVRR